MSDRDDLERDMAEEDELASILRPSDQRGLLPPFAEVARRAEQHRHTPALALAAAAALVVVVVAGIGGWRAASTGAGPSGSPVPSATRDASASAPPCFAPPPATALVGARASGQWLQTSLDAVQPTDPQTNQLDWVLRFMVPQGAPAPATVYASARISVSSPNDRQQILGYEITEPQRSVADGEALSVKPCNSLVLVVRMAGPLIDGTFPYTIAVEKVDRPEGGTVTESFDVRLACSNRTRTCAVADAAATPAPTPTPVAGILNPSFGLIYDGVRTEWAKGSAPLVRREGESHFAVGELAPSYFNKPNLAIAPDGRRAMYFAQRLNEPWALYLLDGARPNEQRVLATIPQEIPAGTLVWSGDGTGVAFAVLDEGANQGVVPKYSAVRTLDLSSRAVTEIARVEGGSHYELVGWDRANGRLAAMIAPHGEAPTTYVVFSGAGKREWKLDSGYSAVAAPNGRDVAAVLCQGPTLACSFWTWRLEDFDTRVDQKFGPGLSMGIIGWRPGTTEVGLFVANIAGGGPGRIELWSPAAGRRVVFGPGERVSGDAFFRADGSALIVTLALDEAVVVDVASGRTSPLPLPAPEAPWEVGRLRASIRLGS